VKQVEEQCRAIGVGRIATVCGRFWAMDRDNRWERVSQAYDLLAGRRAVMTAPNPLAAVQQYYDHPLNDSQKGDEFVAPTWVVGADGKPVATIGNGDAVLFYNYRGDRPREITKAFVVDGFADFDRGPKLDLYYATMTEYEKGLPGECDLREARSAEKHSRPGRERRRPRAVPLRRDRKEPSRHLFLQ
jgi:2,3-bisphosphoglycerate-independent phosphoglycerate mutase